MSFQQRSDCLESPSPLQTDRGNHPCDKACPEGFRSRFSIGLGILAGLLATGSVHAAGSTASVDLAIFSPDSVLNGYWMYMDSTITTPNGDFATADEGRVGAGAGMKVNNGGRFKTPTLIRGDVVAIDGKEKYFDSSLWVLGNANLAKTAFTSALSKVRVDGSLDYSNMGGEDSAETWVGGALNVYGNTAFRNQLHIRSSLSLATPVVYGGTVSYDPATVGLGLAGIPAGMRNPTAAWAPPFSNPVFFDSTKIPGHGLTFTLPAGRENVTGSYATTVCNGTTVVCKPYPGVSYNAKSIPAGTVLPPGYYANLTLTNEILILGEGFYYFDKVQINNSSSKLVAYQPTGERTIIYARDGFATDASSFIYIGSDSGFLASKFGVSSSPDDFGGGTVMITTGPHADIALNSSDARVWATLSAPTGTISANSQFYLYGQMFGRHFNAANNFNGGAGKFVPFFPEKPVVSFNVALFNASVKEGNLLPNGDPDTVIARFPVQMDHINGSAVTVWYHTAPITATSGGTTAAGTRDYVHVAKGSVTIPPLFDTASILVKVLGDIASEGDETFRVVIDSVTNGTLGRDSVGVGTIRDDDSTMYVRLVPVAPTRLTRPAVSAAADTAFHYKLEVFDKVTGLAIAAKFDVSAKLRLVDS